MKKSFYMETEKGRVRVEVISIDWESTPFHLLVEMIEIIRAGEGFNFWNAEKIMKKDFLSRRTKGYLATFIKEVLPVDYEFREIVGFAWKERKNKKWSFHVYIKEKYGYSKKLRITLEEAIREF